MRVPSWSPPKNWNKITTIDAHTAGEPFRVVTSGVPNVAGPTMIEKRRWAKENLDDLRRVLMWEPRGHADMYGCIVTDPVSDDADFGVLFMHNEGWSTMCGHGIIAIAMIAIETGMVAFDGAETEVAIDTPAGLVRALVLSSEDTPTTVRFRNVPSFVDSLDEKIAVPGLGAIRYDLAFGGAYYAFVDAGEVGAACSPDQAPRFIEAGRAIKESIAQSRPINHPTDDELGFLYGVIFTGPSQDTANHSRQVCVFADGEIDRSPTGTGVSARLAILRARGEIEIGQTIRIESIIGSLFKGRIAEECLPGNLAALIPEVDGEAFITGCHEFLLDPADSIGQGFLLR